MAQESKTLLFLFQALKLLHNSTEFLPYVIYIAPRPPEAYKVLTENGKPSQNIELAVSRKICKIIDLIMQAWMKLNRLQ